MVREVLVRLGGARRRSGAILVVEDDDRLVGIFTDSDLARLFERNADTAFDRPIAEVMTRNPKHISADALASEAMALMHPGRIDELPVVNDAGEPVGIIDVQDLVVLKMLDVDPAV
jgi:arabinose-5-phosphate isomerase